MMAHQDERFEMSPDLQATIITACKEHEKREWLDTDWRPCVSIDENYFVKFGAQRDLEPERATQAYLFDHAQRCQSASPLEDDTPRIAEILHHFVDDCTMYLVMEYIKLAVTSPADLAERIHKALIWLSEVPLPPGPKQTLGPVGGGRIRHRFFKNYEAPFPIADVAMLDQYIQKAYNSLSPPVFRQATPPITSILGERVMFTQSDMDESNFGVDAQDGRTVLMDFREVGVLPETFVASTLGKCSPTLEALGIVGNANGYSMAAIGAMLWVSASTRFGMDKKNLTESKNIKPGE